MKFNPSNEQKEMFSTMTDNEHKSFSFIAPAGCGKTSTIMFFMDQLSASNKILYLVFNLPMKKEMEGKINRSGNYYNGINTDNIEVLTLNGYMRKVLQSKIENVVFDYRNGDFAPQHLKLLFDNIVDDYSVNSNSAYVTESFNAYIKYFLQSTINLEDFMHDTSNLPNINDNVVSDLKKILSLNNIHIDSLPFTEQQEAIKNVYDGFLKSIFYNDELNQSMPHSIYYKYAYERYGNENLFEGYDYIFVDEGQDVDNIIMSLLKKSNIKVVKFGDDFQHINAFRGTINSLQDEDSIVKFLTMSYRLSPYHALLVSAYLKEQGSKLGIDEDKIPTIYGYTKKQSSTLLSEQKVNNLPFEEYSNKAIEIIGDIKIENNDIYSNTMEQKAKIEQSIISGCKTKFKQSVKEFSSSKEYDKFLADVMEYTNYLSNSLVSPDENTDYRQLLSEEIKNEDKFGKVHSMLFDIARAYSVRFTKKEKIELLENSSYSFLARNNDKVIDFGYKFVSDIPYEPLSDFPLFNIRLNTTLANKFNEVSNNKWNSLSVREIAIFKQGLEELKHPTVGLSLNKMLDALKNIKMQEQILEVLIDNPYKSEQLVSMNIISVGDSKFSPKEFGITSDGIRSVVKNAISQTKRKSGIDEVSAKDILSCDVISSWQNFVKIDNLILDNYSIENIEDINNPLLNNYYKYSKIKSIASINPNISLVGDGNVSNVYFSTVHASKGLEFENVFIGNDVYNEQSVAEMELKDQVAEFYLAYVAMTRTKGSLSMEGGSDLYKQIEEVIKNGLERTFVSNGVLVKENLAEIPKISAVYSDSFTKELKTKEVSFYDNSSYPSYKDIAVLSDEHGDVSSLNFFNEPLPQTNETLKKSFLKPATDENVENIQASWEQEQAIATEEQKQLAMEAEDLF